MSHVSWGIHTSFFSYVAFKSANYWLAKPCNRPCLKKNWHFQKVWALGLNIVAAVEQQGAAPQEIASSVSRAASGTQEISQNVAAASDASTMVSEEANSLLPSSNEMREQPHLLHDEVLRFLQSVRRNQ